MLENLDLEEIFMKQVMKHGVTNPVNNLSLLQELKSCYILSNQI